MLDERWPDVGIGLPHNDVRLYARVESALGAPLPGWPPPLDCIDDVPEPLVEAAQTISSPCFVIHRRISVASLKARVAEFEARVAELEGSRAASDDNASAELTALARRGDEAGFRALAACVMPLEEVGECWAGTRGRLGLPT